MLFPILCRLIHEPEFAVLIESDRFYVPRTDGKELYWQDGPAITLSEIFGMVMSCDDAPHSGTQKKEVLK